MLIRIFIFCVLHFFFNDSCLHKKKRKRKKFLPMLARCSVKDACGHLMPSVRSTVSTIHNHKNTKQNTPLKQSTQTNKKSFVFTWQNPSTPVLPTSTYVCMQVSVGRYIRTRVTYLHPIYLHYDRQIGKQESAKRTKTYFKETRMMIPRTHADHPETLSPIRLSPFPMET